MDKFNSITEENLSMKQIQKKWNNFKTNQKKKNSDKDFDDEVKTDVLKMFGKVNYLLVIISCFDIISVDPLISGNFWLITISANSKRHKSQRPPNWYQKR